MPKHWRKQFFRADNYRWRDTTERPEPPKESRVKLAEGETKLSELSISQRELDSYKQHKNTKFS